VPIHPFEPARGRVEMLTVDSTALGDNLVGDPTRRTSSVDGLRDIFTPSSTAVFAADHAAFCSRPMGAGAALARTREKALKNCGV